MFTEPDTRTALFLSIRRHQRLQGLILNPKDMPDLWFVTSYVLHTATAHRLIYAICSKVADKLPLSPDPVHDYEKIITNSRFFVADMKESIHGFHFADKDVGRKISRGEGVNGKNIENSKKQTKNSIIKPLSGEATEKRPKNSKKRPKNNTIKPLSSIYYICTMHENPGGGGAGHPRCRRPCLQIGGYCS